MKKSMIRGVVLAVLGAGFATAAFGERLVKEGEKIVMIGDSITMYGVQKNYGYCNLFQRAIYTSGVRNFTIIGKGSDGDTSSGMNGRFQRDVLANNPTLITVCAGANDYTHGVSTESFMANIDSMVQKAKTAGVPIILITPTGRADKDAPTPVIDGYAAAMRTYAAANGIPLADANVQFRAAVNDPLTPPWSSSGLKTTRDGVHLNPLGDRAMARSLLPLMGLTDAEIAAVEEDWNGARVVCDYGNLVMSLDQYEKLEQFSDTMHRSVFEASGDVFMTGMDEFLAKPFVPVMPTCPTPGAGAAADCAGGDIILCGGTTLQFENSFSSGRLCDRLRKALEANGSDRQLVTGRADNHTLVQINTKFDTIVAAVSGSANSVSHLVIWPDGPSTANLAAEIQAASNIVTKAAAKGITVVFTTVYSEKGVDSSLNPVLRGLDNGTTVRAVDSFSLLWAYLEPRKQVNASASLVVSGKGYLSAKANYLIGSAMLPCLGFNAAAVQRADAWWHQLPNFGMMTIWDTRSIGYGAFDRLRAFAATNDLTLVDVFSACLRLGAAKADQMVPVKNALVPDANTFSNGFAFVSNEYNVISGTATPGARIDISRKGISTYGYANAAGVFSFPYNPGTTAESQKTILSDGVNSLTVFTTLTDTPAPPVVDLPGASFLLY